MNSEASMVVSGLPATGSGGDFIWGGDIYGAGSKVPSDFFVNGFRCLTILMSINFI